MALQVILDTASRPHFWLFCLVVGWCLRYGVSPFLRVPTINAAIDKGAAIWMLGVLLGLRAGLKQNIKSWFPWAAAMFVYPVLTLLLGGFVSYGATALTICVSPLAVSIRSYLRTIAGLAVISILAFNLFLSYYQNRNSIREAVWGGADISTRIEAAGGMFRDLTWFDPRNPDHLRSLDERLNQNYFVGLAAARLDSGEVEYLNGRSIEEGVLALVPRYLWPDKPVFGGSPAIVSDMTGLVLSDTTSFGVGNVMEFHINFGVPGVVVGFLILGWAMGRLDALAAGAEMAGDFPKLLRCFLPAVALIQPNGSMVEVCGGSVAAWVAGVGWGWVWLQWSSWRRIGQPD